MHSPCGLVVCTPTVNGPSINEESSIILSGYADGKDEKLIYRIDRLDDNDMTLTLQPGDTTLGLMNANIVMNYHKDDFVYANAGDDIYSVTNNHWRQKPKDPETPGQVKERLKANIHYLIIYLNNTLIRDEESISMAGVISPIEFGSNGIALKARHQLPEEWINVFYNETQAMEAFQSIEYAFHEKITFNKFDNWIALDMDLLKQVYAKIE
jgi:hypothetical protein